MNTVGKVPLSCSEVKINKKGRLCIEYTSEEIKNGGCFYPVRLSFAQPQWCSKYMWCLIQIMCTFRTVIAQEGETEITIEVVRLKR
jgi:hypothetical protein